MDEENIMTTSLDYAGPKDVTRSIQGMSSRVQNCHRNRMSNFLPPIYCIQLFFKVQREV